MQYNIIKEGGNEPHRKDKKETVIMKLNLTDNEKKELERIRKNLE